MTAVGETLRRERLRRNLDLDWISRELKISSRMLQAIEDERFERLPGGVFARSFVRQYARLLGLDEDEMAAQVQRQLEPGDEAPKLPEIQKPIAADLRVPRVERWSGRGDSRPWSSSLPALALLVLAMLVCSGIYAWWQKARRAPAATVSVNAAAAQTQPAAAPPASVPVQPAPETPAMAAPEPGGAQPPAAQSPAAQPPSAPVAAPARRPIRTRRCEWR
jgi:cytoskeleton protein RodZ